jgi:hypothetical protein
MGGASGMAHGHAFGAAISARRARRMILDATEAELRERGLEVPKYLSQAAMFWFGFLAGAVCISLPWWLFWELT